MHLVASNRMLLGLLSLSRPVGTRLPYCWVSVSVEFLAMQYPFKDRHFNTARLSLPFRGRQQVCEGNRSAVVLENSMSIFGAPLRSLSVPLKLSHRDSRA